MAMVSSCIGSVTPLGVAGQPVGVQGLRYRIPWPRGPGAHVGKGIRLEDHRFPLAPGNGPVQLLELGPVLRGDTVQRQAGKVVALMEGETPGVPVVLAE